MKITFMDLRDRIDTVEELKVKFLLERGWVHTCATQGSFWMWKKQMPNGCTLLVTQDFALNICRIEES